MTDASNRLEDAEAVAVQVRRCAYRDAVETTWKHFGDHVGRMCMALLADQRKAEDATARVLVAAYRAGPRLEETRAVRPFLFRNALHVCQEMLAGVGERERARDLSLNDGDGRRLPGDAAAATRRARRTRAALARLKPTERNVAVLRYTAGLDYDEVAEVTGLEVAEVKKRLGKAVLNLRQALRDQEDDP
ncbi:MAG: sigma-70 family RNA polymerase sigma factor [Myxococcales bacterium]